MERRVDDMIRVLLVNQILLISNVMAAVLEDEPDIEVIGCAASIDRAMDLAPNSDVVLVSTDLASNGALKVTRAIAEAEPSAKVLVVGLAESEKEILRYVQAGAAGYVLKDDSAEDLIERIRSAYSEKALISPRIAAALMSRIAELANMAAEVKVTTDGSNELTPREREILELIGEGLTNQQIAERLVIEVGTVKNHVHSILQKLDASNRHDAAAFLAVLD
jgi:two-component system nitrate/nitrite response regulator NarL